MVGLCDLKDQLSGALTREGQDRIHICVFSLDPSCYLCNCFCSRSFLDNVEKLFFTIPTGSHGKDNYIHGFVSCQEVKTQKCVKVMSDIGKRIRELRKILGLTQEQFGERIGKSWRTIQDWEAGKSNIPDHTLKFISSTFGVSYEWLKEGKGDMWEREKLSLEEIIEREQRKLLESKIKVPVVGKAGAGFPHSPSDIEVLGVVFVSKSPHLKEGKIFAVQVHGDSMHPALTEGDYVVFQTYEGDGSDIPNGKIVVVKNHSGELLVKRLLKMNGTVLLAGDNPKYPPILPQQAEAEDLRIVGVVVKILKEFEA